MFAGSNIPERSLWPILREKKITIEGSEWTFAYYEEYSDVVKDDESMAKLFKPYLAPHFGDHRVQINVGGMPLLFGFFISEKTVCTYSPRLGRELFLIEQVEAAKLDDDISALALQKQYQAFKSYAEKVAALDINSFPSEHDLATYRYDLTPIIDNEEFIALDSDVEALIKKLRSYLNEYKTSPFEKMSDFGLDLTARFALLRIHLLKFLAILPNLDHDLKGDEVKRILLESFRRLSTDSREAQRLMAKGQEAALPNSVYYGVRVAYHVCRFIPPKSLAKLIRFCVRMMAKRFIAGENIESVQGSFSALFATGRDVTLDQLGELVVSEKEADGYRDEVIKLICGFGRYIDKGEKNTAGINRAHVSIKVSALCSDFKPQAPEYTYKLVAPRLKEILMIAMEHEVYINIDAEHYHYRDLVLTIYRRVLLETPELKGFEQTGIVLQAYLRDGAAHLKDIIELAKERGLRMPIRIVKGAYWDAETIEADAHSFNAPQFLNKEETDLNFRQLTVEIFKNDPHVQLCLASHNFEDHCFAVVLRDNQYSHVPHIEHQCLHMTYEALSTGLAKMGWATRNYVPVGSLIVGMAYLVRRIMENSSQVGVLTIMRSHKKMNRLEGPGEVHRAKKENEELSFDLTKQFLTSDFFNITPMRLYLEDERRELMQSLEHFKKNGLGKNYDGADVFSGTKLSVHSSSDPTIMVGQLQLATSNEADLCAERSYNMYKSGKWSQKHWLIRAGLLLKVADLMLAKRKELSALIVYESGKSAVEALGDVDEAVDFLNFYARSEQVTQNENPSIVQLGPVCAITPWNFPLAIPTGMIAAPLVAGNTVVLKPAGQTPLIAKVLVDLFIESGIPKDALIFCPGEGSDVGNTLVNNSYFSSYVFTGSKRVGQMIAGQAAKRIFTNPVTNYSYPVKAVTEMGGKNAIIVTANAELDETVAGILYSSFAHAGQKCSAASRVIVDARVKDRLIERLKEACQDIEVSEAFNMSCAVNPIISEKESERLKREVKEACLEAEDNGGQVIIDRSGDTLPGYCIGPALIELPKNQALKEDSFARRELFGPVVHLISFDGLDEALELFNDTDYGLTGGIFSQSQDDIDYLSEQMACGNIYINRSITGARVGIEPFGGFKMSGTGPKAGSKAYVPTFHHVPYAHLSEDEPEQQCTGSDFSFDLCRRSGLWSKARVQKTMDAMELIIQRYEILFAAIGEEKEQLKTFQKWLSRYGEQFMDKQHPNHIIPGQLCYSDFSMGGEYAIVASNHEKPHLTTLLRTLSALCMGVGVTVLCRSEKSYTWWTSLHNYFVQVGFSKENFNVFKPSLSLFEEKVRDPLVSYLIADGNQSWVSYINEVASSDYKDDKRMKKIMSVMDAPEIQDYKNYLVSFAWVRAFAVNTMRHGAPMNITIQESNWL
jgi:RHH-type proline utilization regulon transcriptional repressor/proline dehydrogenase/delta 1-pyrroline-5-carboxylate dehydrogenase